MIDPNVVDSAFCAKAAPKSLRVTCYGSSSSKTPERYLREARSLGYILARRGHVCVNGAGSFGCMAAMNDGCLAGNGHVVGVIHEMFLVDNGYWGDQTVIRDGGAHRVFENAKTRNKDEYKAHDHGADEATQTNETGPIREILVAGGEDLQERKKLLVKKADGLVVLPGGPGTWDELWEMACARHLNLNQLPIVCVNVDGFYEPFREMLDHAYEDELIRLPPHEIVHFAPTAEAAVRWIEDAKDNAASPSKGTATTTPPGRWMKSRKSLLQRSSFFSASPYQQQDGRSSLFSSFDPLEDWSPWTYVAVAFAAGSALGVATASFIFANSRQTLIRR